MSKVVVDLPPPLETFVNELVAEGHYVDASEVVRDAVRRFAADTDLEYAAKLAALREAIRPGLEDAKAGRFAEGTMEDFIAELNASKKA